MRVFFGDHFKLVCSSSLSFRKRISWQAWKRSKRPKGSRTVWLCACAGNPCTQTSLRNEESKTSYCVSRTEPGVDTTRSQRKLHCIYIANTRPTSISQWIPYPWTKWCLDKVLQTKTRYVHLHIIAFSCARTKRRFRSNKGGVFR